MSRVLCADDEWKQNRSEQDIKCKWMRNGGKVVWNREKFWVNLCTITVELTRWNMLLAGVKLNVFKIYVESTFRSRFVKTLQCNSFLSLSPSLSLFCFWNVTIAHRFPRFSSQIFNWSTTAPWYTVSLCGTSRNKKNTLFVTTRKTNKIKKFFFVYRTREEKWRVEWAESKIRLSFFIDFFLLSSSSVCLFVWFSLVHCFVIFAKFLYLCRKKIYSWHKY